MSNRTGSTGTVGSSMSDVSDGVIEIKEEYSEITIEEEKANNFSAYDNERRINQQPGQQDPAINLWTSKATSCLISQYRKYRSMVGQSTQFRSLRDMFETISVEMQKYGYYFSPQKCENKWRVLERKYKNLVMREMMKKPGRMKHYGHWEHKRALDEIFDEKRKSVYLDESEYPSVGTSTKYALILPKPAITKSGLENNRPQTSINFYHKIIEKDFIEKPKKTSSDFESIIEPLLAAELNKSSAKNKEESAKDSTGEYLEKIVLEIRKCFDVAEKNKERRHSEKMAIRRSELKVQEKILKLKEKKLELEKRKILAMAHDIQLNIE